jgi:hypothetical protein
MNRSRKRRIKLELVSSMAPLLHIYPPQGLKPLVFPAISARLKSCPDTKRVYETCSKEALWVPCLSSLTLSP